MRKRTEWLFANQSSEQVSRVLNEHVYYEILYAFGVPRYDVHNYTLWGMVNLARISHARVLLSFFETSAEARKKKNHQSDDVISEDYGFLSRKISELSAEDRLRFGKDLFHLSYARLRHLEQPKQKPWPPAILSGIHRRAVEFISYLLSADAPANLYIMRADWERLHRYLCSGRVLHFDSSIVIPRKSWIQFYEGELLPEGLSRLTDYPIRPITKGGGLSAASGNSAPSALGLD